MMDHTRDRGYEPYLIPREGESLICRARNRAIGDFLESPCEWFFTVDDDLLLPEDALTKLLEAQKSVIGGFYRIKTTEYLATATRPVGLAFVDIIDQKRVAPAEFLAGGLTLVKRYVIQDMWDYYTDLEYEENLTRRPLVALYQPFIIHNGEHREYLSEDWAFCQRIKDAGYELWCHGGVVAGHLGTSIYSLELDEDALQRYRKREGSNESTTAGHTPNGASGSVHSNSD